MKRWIYLSLVISLSVLGTACDQSSEETAEEAQRRVNDAAKRDIELREVVEAERAEAVRRLEQRHETRSKKNEALHEKRVELDTLFHRVGNPKSPEFKAKLASLYAEIRGRGEQKSLLLKEISSLTLHKDHIKELDAIEEIDSHIALLNKSVGKFDVQIAEMTESLKELQQQAIEVEQLMLEFEQLFEVVSRMDREAQMCNFPSG
jgi:hypothetical protein